MNNTARKEIRHTAPPTRAPQPHRLASASMAKKKAAPAPDATTPAKMNALERLIKSRMSELGISYEQAGKRGGMPPTTIWQLANKPEHNRVPRQGTLIKLAKALDVPLDLLKSAAADAAGYGVEEVTLSGGTTLQGAENVRAVVAGMEKLSTAEQNRLRSIVNAYVNSVLAERGTGQG